MNRRSSFLFSDVDIIDLSHKMQSDILQEIDSIDANTILQKSTDDLCEIMFEKYSLEMPHIVSEDIYISETEVDVDVSHDTRRFIRDTSRPFYIKGQRITFHIPFEGSPFLFRVNPATWGGGRPQGTINGNEICIGYDVVDHNIESLKRNFDSDLAKINELLRSHEGRVPAHNDTIKQSARSKIEARKQKLLKDQGLVASLGFPMKKRDDAPTTYIAPVTRKKLSLSSSTQTSKPFAPEPALAIEEYEHILKVISGMVVVMERSPQAFKGMAEEDLRQHFLVQLNGQYDGQATGETFNFDGKTDILIRVDGKNIFIAECKIWRGQKAFLDTIDQLLGYVSWRDTKTAIIIFNRNKDLSAVIAQIPSIVTAHPNCKRQMEYPSETGFRFVIHHRDDVDRDLILTILVFEVPE